MKKIPPCVTPSSFSILAGGSSGIGEAVAIAAAVQGCHVTIIARNHANLEKTKAAIEAAVAKVGFRDDERPSIDLATCDVTYGVDTERILSTIHTRRRINILVT